MLSTLYVCYCSALCNVLSTLYVCYFSALCNVLSTHYVCYCSALCNVLSTHYVCYCSALCNVLSTHYVCYCSALCNCCPHFVSVTVQRYVMCCPNTVTAVPCTVHSLTCVTSQCYLHHQTSNTIHTLYVCYCSVLCDVLSTHFVTVLCYAMYCLDTLCYCYVLSTKSLKNI